MRPSQLRTDLPEQPCQCGDFELHGSREAFGLYREGWVESYVPFQLFYPNH